MLEINEILGDGNIVELLDKQQLSEIYIEVSGKVDSDRDSMSDYLKQYKEALKLAKMEWEGGNKTFPFVGASTYMTSMLIEAAIDFNSRAAPSVIGTDKICKAQILGDDEDIDGEEKRIVSAGISRAVNGVIYGQTPYWRSDFDRLLMSLCIVGNMFKKTWFDGVQRKVKSEIIFPDDLIFDHKGKGINCCSCVAHESKITQNEMVSGIRSGRYYYEEIKLPEDKDEYTVVEAHCDVDIDDDGYCEPYIVDYCEELNCVLSIQPLFTEDDVRYNADGEIIEVQREQYFSHIVYMPCIGNSCMGMGWGILLGNDYKTINTNTRQLLDAGTLSNAGNVSGFIREGSAFGARGGNRQRKKPISLVLGQFTPIEGSGTNPLENDLARFPVGEPSQTLLTMMEGLKTEVRSLTTGRNIESNAGEAAELYIARLQQGLKIPTSIMMRVYNGVTDELSRIAYIIENYFTDEEYQLYAGKDRSIINDFSYGDIVIRMTADPSQGSEQEQIAKASMVYNMSQTDQQIDPHEAKRRLFEAVGIHDIDQLLIKPSSEPNPRQIAEQQYIQQQQQTEQAKAQAALVSANARMQDSVTKAKEAQVDSLKTIAETAQITQDVNFGELEKFQQLAEKEEELTNGGFKDGSRRMAEGRDDQELS